MSEFLTPLITEEIDSKYARITAMFRYWSDLLNCNINVPISFVCDYESVPIIKGTSKRGGVIHDYLCRTNSKPVVTKEKAAAVYLEAMASRDFWLLRKMPENTWWQRVKKADAKFDKWLRRNIKYNTVRVAWGYFHKFTVEATYEEISGQ